MYNFQQRETATILKRMTVSDLFLNDLTVDSINNHHDLSPIEYRFLAAKTYRRCQVGGKASKTRRISPIFDNQPSHKQSNNYSNWQHLSRRYQLKFSKNNKPRVLTVSVVALKKEVNHNTSVFTSPNLSVRSRLESFIVSKTIGGFEKVLSLFNICPYVRRLSKHLNINLLFVERNEEQR